MLAAGRRAAETTRAPATIGASAMAPGARLADALRRPELSIADVLPHFRVPVDAAIGTRIEIELKMDGYVKRQQEAIDRAARDEAVVLPSAIDYGTIRALSHEARQKFELTRPRTLGAARRIPGITPTDVALLSVHVHRLAREPA
jgi:tRNA uridine 5-carboxymethylaminomethyl modification enzyme